MEWFRDEIKDLEPHLKTIIFEIFISTNELCRFPQKKLLLWSGCDRKKVLGKQKYHIYPDEIKAIGGNHGIHLDTRPNGPAVAAFELAGGIRPQRYGSKNKWHIHHLYSGKFPYIGRPTTLHAAQDGSHFTQAAGLVAVHPLLDALADESPAFTWFLRYKAYEKFGYDPDCVFSEKIDEYGFCNDHLSAI